MNTKTLSSIALLALLSACSGGGGGTGGIPLALDENETPANDTPATANTLKLGTPIRGEVLVAGDVDCFAIHLTNKQVVRFELFGTRNDQASWDTNLNVPRLTILDTDANANAKLLEQDNSGNFSDGWGWGFHDLDIPMFQAPATGTYFISVTQDDQTAGGGAYMLRASSVSTPGLQEETEARGVSGDNDTFATAETIHSGVLHGFHVADELDYYKFTISAPTVVRFELNAYRNGVHDGTALYYDTTMQLYDTDGTTVLFDNDDTYFYDSAIQYELTTPGTYFVAVNQFDTGMSGEYFLTMNSSPATGAMETEPNDDAATATSIAYGGRRRGTIATGETDFYKFTGHAGDMVRLQYFDSGNAQAGTDSIDVSLVGTDGTTALATGGNGDFQTLTTILQETGTFYVEVQGGAGTSPYAIELKLFESSVYETEPNDTSVDAGGLSDRVSGVIATGGDVDMFRVSLTKNKLVRFVCYASNSATDSDGSSEYSGHGSDLAPLIELVDNLGVVVASSTSVPVNGVFTESVTQPLPTSCLCTTVTATGPYFVRISDANAASGATYYYVLEYTRE
jgi:hypothetical protein